MPAVLLIEDNERLADLLDRGLTREGFQVTKGHSVADAFENLALLRFDAVLMDLGLPDGDGITAIRTLRDKGEQTPIVIMSARGELRDRVEGFSAGADEYLVKPVALEELAARLRAVRRRSAKFEADPRVGNLVLDPESRCVLVDDVPQPIGGQEFSLLSCLVRRQGRLVWKDVLTSQLYGLQGDTSSNTVDVYIYRLRKRLEAMGATANLRTVRGVGYVISDTGAAGSDATGPEAA